MSFPKISEVLTDTYKAFKIVDDLSHINITDYDACINSPDDFAIMEDVHGNRFLFLVSESATFRPPASRNKSLPTDEACYIKKTNKGIEWINCPPWVKRIGKNYTLGSVDLEARTITVKGITDSFKVASWITDEELEELQKSRYAFDVKTLDGYLTAFAVNWEKTK